MNLKKLCEGIQLQNEMIAQIETFLVDYNVEALEGLLQELGDPKTSAVGNQRLREMFQDTGPAQIPQLTCHLLCAMRNYPVFQEKGISDQIYYDTMAAFTRFCKECHENTGNWYFDRAFWTYRQASMLLFRIGILEYEFKQIEGKEMISIHIPSDVVFTEENLDYTIQAAREFIKCSYPKYVCAPMFCDSWLMAPKLRALLPDTAGIIRFQNRFTVVKEESDSDDCVKWLFRCGEQILVSEYPEDTSLQRTVKQLMLEGGHLGAGYGILKEKT